MARPKQTNKAGLGRLTRIRVSTECGTRSAVRRDDGVICHGSFRDWAGRHKGDKAGTRNLLRKPSINQQCWSLLKRPKVMSADRTLPGMVPEKWSGADG